MFAVYKRKNVNKVLGEFKSDLTPPEQRAIRHDHFYTDTPRTMRKKLDFSKKRFTTVAKQNKALKQRVRRLKRSVKSMKAVVRSLK